MGSRASVTVWRRGAQVEVPVTIVELQEERPTPGRQQPKKPAPNATPDALGLHMSAIPPADRKALGIDHGLLVEEAQGPAATAGIQPGDVILQWNNTPITSVEQFKALLAKHDKSKAVALLVQREETTQYITLKPRQ